MGDFVNNFDEDPAAEFLAREQDDLAGLEEDLKPAISVPAGLGGELKGFGAYWSCFSLAFSMYMFSTDISVCMALFLLAIPSFFYSLRDYEYYMVSVCKCTCKRLKECKKSSIQTLLSKFTALTLILYGMHTEYVCAPPARPSVLYTL